MADIRIEREHSLDVGAARERLAKVADELKDSYGIEASWEGNTARLSGPGIKSGTARVTESRVHIEITLGLLAGAFKERIEHEIRSRSDDILV